MNIKTITACFTGLFSTVFLTTAFAQNDNVLEEVIVMAQKREQTLNEVPIAVSVVEAQTIKEAQITDMLSLQSLVPSLKVTQLQTTANTNFIIRGFGNGANNPGIEPSVGVFIDGVYRSRSAAAIADLPNLERVEVLRGPQSTLFGKNASAGVINIVTAAPNMEEYGGGAEFVYGNYNQMIFRADVSGPISETVGFSLAAYGNQRDGYFKNLETGTDLNERDRWGARGQLLWLPSETTTLRLIVDYDKVDEKCCGVANLVAGDTTKAIFLVGGKLIPNDAFAREQYYDFDPTNKITNKGVSLQADFDFSNDLTLTSITAYRTSSRLDDADVDFTSAKLISVNSADAQIDTFSQEFRLTQSLDNVDWLLGAYYFDETVKYDNDLKYDDAFRPYADIVSMGNVTALEQQMIGLELLPPSVRFFDTGQGTYDATGQDDKTTSLFGQLDWNVSEKVTLSGGLNYTKVKKDAFISQRNTDIFSALDFVQVGFGAIFYQLTGLPPTLPNIIDNPAAAGAANAFSTVECTAETAPACNPVLELQPLQFLPPFVDYPNSVEPGTSNDSKVTWTARVAYQANDNINLYGSAGTGFKATSWNLSRDSSPFAKDIPALEAAGLAVNNMTAGTRYAGPEDALVYELGFKGSWATSMLNIAAFYQEIEGFQSNIFTGTGFILQNAGKQSTKGIELDSLWLPTEALKLMFSATWLDPTYDSFEEGEGVDGAEDLSGTTPAGIPEFSVNTSATYYFDLGNTNAFIRGEYVYESEVQVVENVSAEIASRKISMINASFGFNWDSGWDLMFWGRNLNNDDFLLSAFPATAQDGSYSGYPNQPRTYGATVRKRF